MMALRAAVAALCLLASGCAMERAPTRVVLPRAEARFRDAQLAAIQDAFDVVARELDLERLPDGAERDGGGRFLRQARLRSGDATMTLGVEEETVPVGDCPERPLVPWLTAGTADVDRYVVSWWHENSAEHAAFAARGRDRFCEELERSGFFSRHELERRGQVYRVDLSGW